jgi:hypothetical protein
LELQKPSVLAAKHDTNRYADAKFRRDALLGLERCAGEVITEMLDIVENYDPDEAQMQLVMRGTVELTPATWIAPMICL